MDFSLRLPGFADEDNGNPVQMSGAKILNLPEKCIINIIKHVPSQNMDDIIELFPKWDEIVQEHVPVEVHLTDVGFRIAHHYFMGHEELSKYRIKIIHSRVLDEQIPELKSPEDLEMIEFATHTEPSTFKSLVAKAVNLRELSFGYGSLSGQSLSDLEFNFPNLRILNISDRPIEFKGDAETQQKLPNNIIGLLNKEFPCIETLNVITGASRKQTVDFAKSLLKFIQRHCETLKNLKFNVITLVQGQGSESSGISDLVTISSAKEQLDMDRLTSVKLKIFEVNFGQNFYVGLDQWTAILSNQKGLTELKIGFEKQLPPAFYVVPLSQSGETLTVLRIGVDVYNERRAQRNIFDCCLLKNCHALQRVSLTGPEHPENASKRPPFPEIWNMEQLPETLIALEIENIFVETKQIAEIGERLKKLEEVQMKNVGVSGLYGVPVTLLDAWIKAKQLKEIVLKGVNGEGVNLHDYNHLVKFGLTSPLSKCKVHALYYFNLKEYAKPRENTVKVNNAFEFS